MPIRYLSGVNVDSNTLVVDAANDRVGIGTASPGAKLHLSGAGATELRIASTTGNTNSLLSFYEVAIASWGIDAGQANGSFFIKDLYNSATRLTILNSGNVGIGTTNPTYKLDVAGGDVRFVAAASTDALVRIIAANYATEYDARLFLGENDTNGMTIEYDGSNNVGFIGMNSSTDPTGAFSKRIRMSRDGSEVSFPVGNVGIGTTAPQDKLTVKGATNYNLNLGLLGGYSGIYVYNDASSAYNHLRIDASPLLLNSYSGANVGIGTAAPASLLHVATAGTTGSTSMFLISRASGYGHTLFEQTYDSAYFTAGKTLTLKNDSGTAFIHFAGNNAGTQTNVLIPTGNVGIGTTAPYEKLEVAGAISATGATASLSAQGHSTTLAVSSGISYLYAVDWGAEFKPLSVQGKTISLETGTGSTSARVTIDNSGNVGIGTTSPSNKLEVVGGVTIGTPASSTVNLYLTRTNAGIAADANYFVSANNTPNQTWIEGGYYNGELSGVVTAPNSGYPYIETYSGQGGSTTKSFGFINKTSGSFTSADVFIAMSLLRTGRVTFNKYGVGTFTGTATQRLAVDASGNVIEIPIGSGPVDGNGTANYVTKWSDADTITNSVIYENGGNIGIGVTNADYPLTVGSINVGGAGANLGLILNSVINTAIPSSSVKAIIGATNSGFGYAAGSLLIQPRTGVNAVTVFATEGTEKVRITHDGNVGIGTTAPKTKLDINGTIGFGSKSMSMTDTFAAALTINMADHNGCYVKITAFGDWGNHSTIAYLGEFFIQASAGAYNEPGIIIRQVDNTGGGDDIQAQILDPAGAGTRDFIIELKATSSANTPFTAVLQYEVRGQYNSVS